MEWIVREAARLDEMSQGKRSLVVTCTADGDISVAIHHDGLPIRDEVGNESIVEFCSVSGGGGRSPATRHALGQLLLALQADAQADPGGIPPFPLYLREHMLRNLKMP